MTGHLLGGGRAGVGFTVLAVHHQKSPPTINIFNQDPRRPGPLRQCGRDIRIDVALKTTSALVEPTVPWSSSASERRDLRRAPCTGPRRSVFVLRSRWHLRALDCVPGTFRRSKHRVCLVGSGASARWALVLPAMGAAAVPRRGAMDAVTPRCVALGWEAVVLGNGIWTEPCTVRLAWTSRRLWLCSCGVNRYKRGPLA